MTVAELIAYLQQRPQDAVVVLPTYNDRADAFSVTGVRDEPLSVRLRQTYTNDVYPRPAVLYEIDGDGDRDGVLIE
jgi:hypothetical protein